MSLITIKGEEYVIIKLLGQGGFGKVFKVKSGESSLALKAETIESRDTQVGLQKEKKVLRDCFFPSHSLFFFIIVNN